MGFRLAYLDLTLDYSEGQLDHSNDVSPNILAFPFFNITHLLLKTIRNKYEIKRQYRNIDINNYRSISDLSLLQSYLISPKE